MIDIPILGGPCCIGELTFFLGLIVSIAMLPGLFMRQYWALASFFGGAIVAFISLVLTPGGILGQ